MPGCAGSGCVPWCSGATRPLVVSQCLRGGCGRGAPVASPLESRCSFKLPFSLVLGLWGGVLQRIGQCLLGFPAVVYTATCFPPNGLQRDTVVGRQTQAGTREGNHRRHTHRRVTSAHQHRPTTPHIFHHSVSLQWLRNCLFYSS